MWRQTMGPKVVLSSTLDMDLACVMLTATQETNLSIVAITIAGTSQLISRYAAVCAGVPSVDVSENPTDDDDEA